MNGWLVSTIYGSVYILVTVKNYSSFFETISSKGKIYIKKLNGGGISIESKHEAIIDLRENGYFLFVRPKGRVVLAKEEIKGIVPIKMENAFFNNILYL